MNINIPTGLKWYVGLYGLWGVGVNILDLKTTWLRKQEGGGWEKSRDPPFYWDNWSWTHLGWGFAAPFFGVTLPVFTVLNAANEVILEKVLCEASKRGVSGIRFSWDCDPPPHMLADFIYAMIGYGVGRMVAPFKYQEQ